MKIQITDLDTLTEDKLIHVGRKLERYEAVTLVCGVEYGAFGKTKPLALKALVRVMEKRMEESRKTASALYKAVDKVYEKFRKV
jgi:hypothetical protein